MNRIKTFLAFRRAELSRALFAGVALIATLGMTSGQALAQNANGGSKGDKAFGEYLSSLCVTCHQISGQATGAIPPIVAWPEDQFVAVMNSYRWKDRDNEVMQTVAAQLSDDEIASLAAYFGSLVSQPAVR